MELKNVLIYNNQLLLNSWLETYVTGQHKSLSANCLFEQKLTRGTHPLSHQASDNVVTWGYKTNKKHNISCSAGPYDQDALDGMVTYGDKNPPMKSPERSRT